MKYSPEKIHRRENSNDDFFLLGGEGEKTGSRGKNYSHTREKYFSSVAAKISQLTS